MFAERDKQYPSNSGQTSLATAVTNFIKPVTKINSGPSIQTRLEELWAGDVDWVPPSVEEEGDVTPMGVNLDLQVLLGLVQEEGLHNLFCKT